MLNKFRTRVFQFTPLSAVLVTILGYITAQIFGVMLLLLFGAIRGWTTDQLIDNLRDSAWLTMLFTLAINVFYFAIVRAFLLSSKRSLKDIGLKLPPRRWDTILYTLAGYGVYFISAAIVMVIIKYYFPVIDLDQKQELGFDTYTTGVRLVPIFIALVIIPPVIEEIITRGFLYSGLRTKLNVWVAGIITSLIFGAAHLQWGGSAPLLWAAAIDTFLLSGVLIYVREKTDSIVPAVGIHMLKNFTAFLGLFIFHIAG